MIHLFRAWFQADVSEGFERHQLAARSRNRHSLQALFAIGEAIFADDPQVDLVATFVIVCGVRTIDERIHRVTKFLRRHAQVSRLFKLRIDPHFWIRKVQTGSGPNLCGRHEAGCIGRTFQLPKDLASQRNQLIDIRPGNFNIDRASAGESLFKQTCLLGDQKSAGKLIAHFLNDANQIFRASGIKRSRSDEHLAITGHEKEIVDHQFLAADDVGIRRLDIPQRP